MTTLEDAPAEAGSNNVVDLTDLLAKSLVKRKAGASAEHGTRSGAVTMKKAASKASPRRRA